jgi:general secretion pathway protein J
MFIVMNNYKSKQLSSQRKNRGFTLIEILIALFIFSIVSLLLAGGLRNVINAQSGTESKAEKMRELQMVVLILSRDIEQTINRPVLDASGKEEGALIGSPKSIKFTHTGEANGLGATLRSGLARTGYVFAERALYRITYPVLDQAPDTKPHQRKLLADVQEVRFEYMDHDGRFHNEWSATANANEPLPRGIRVYITLAKWGTFTGFYVIPAEVNQQADLAAKPGEKSPEGKQKTSALDGERE